MVSTSINLNSATFKNEVYSSPMLLVPSELDNNQKKPIHILLVDDNFFNLLILENYIKKIKETVMNDYEFTVSKAENGFKAIEIFKIYNQFENNKNI